VVGVVSGRYNSADGWLRDTVWVARTGYTGEKMAFELFVHPERAADFWNAVLKAALAAAMARAAIALFFANRVIVPGLS